MEALLLGGGGGNVVLVLVLSEAKESERKRFDTKTGFLI